MLKKKMVEVISWLKHKEITMSEIKEKIREDNESCKGIAATVGSIAFVLLFFTNFINDFKIFPIAIFIAIGTYFGVSKLKSKKINEKKVSLKINEQELEDFFKEHQDKILDYFSKNETEYNDEQIALLILIKVYIEEKNWNAVIYNIELLLYYTNPTENKKPSFDEKMEIEREMNMNYQL